MLHTYCTQHTWLGVRDKWHEQAISSTGVEPRRLGEPSELTHDAPITSDEHIKRGARSELMPAAPNTNGAHGKRGELNGLGPDRQIFSWLSPNV
jgi:hypothetical protein